MKDASAMKYGGELVAAVDCDYNSFKELVPLCPNCKEPVYLRTGGERLSVKGKAYQIGPHWCHFQGISKEQVAGCELRVNGYTEKDRAKIAAQARGQRMKLLQRWFWKVYLRNHYRLHSAGIPQFTESSFVDAVNKTISQGANPFNLYGGEVNAFLDFVRGSIQRLTTAAGAGRSMREKVKQLTVASLAPGEFQDLSALKVLAAMANAPGIESELNDKIAIQAIEFVCAKGQQSLLQDVVVFNAMALLSVDRFAFDNLSQKEKAWDMASLIVKEISYCPWAFEFQRLEAESQQRKGAA